MKDLYSILEEHKDDETIIYEIVPENSDKRYRELIYNISKLNVEPKYKKFYIEQIKFNTGNYSYKDLFELVNKYIYELKNIIICPYDNSFPILITEKTFIDNIALFIACLKLNLKPQLVELNYIEKIDENISIPDHSFGIYSSGSFNKKLISITEQQLIEKKHYYDDYSNLPIISQGKLYGISGIEKQIIFPIIMGKTSIVTREEEIIETIKNNAKRKIDISLPANCDDLLNQIENPIKTNIERIYIGGGNVNPQRIQKICKLFNAKEEQISLVYGQTESCGIITHSNLIKNQPILKIRLDSLARILLGENYRKDEILIENFDFEKNYIDNPFYIYIFPMGKENSNIKLTNYPIGEIICNGKKTEDIGYISENHIFYVLGRKNVVKSANQNIVEQFYNKYKIYITDVTAHERGKAYFDIDYYGITNILPQIASDNSIVDNHPFFRRIPIFEFGQIKKTTALGKITGVTSIERNTIAKQIDMSDAIKISRTFLEYLLIKSVLDIDERIITSIVDNKTIQDIEIQILEKTKNDDTYLLKIKELFQYMEYIIDNCSNEIQNILLEREKNEEFEELFKIIFKYEVRSYEFTDNIEKIIIIINKILNNNNIDSINEDIRKSFLKQKRLINKELFNIIMHDWEEYIKNEYKSKSL